MNLICGSYFDVPFVEKTFDAAVSAESLHHFTKEEKIPLYTKLKKALKPEKWRIKQLMLQGLQTEAPKELNY